MPPQLRPPARKRLAPGPFHPTQRPPEKRQEQPAGKPREYGASFSHPHLVTLTANPSCSGFEFVEPRATCACSEMPPAISAWVKFEMDICTFRCCNTLFTISYT